MPAENVRDARLARVLEVIRRLRSLASHPRFRPWLLIGGISGFVALAVAAFRNLPDEARDPVLWPLLVLVVVTAPLTVVCNAAEYRLIGRSLGHDVAPRKAVHVTLAATLANYLPAPGGVAVRTAALTREGTKVRSALWMNGIAALLWLGATGVLAGGVLVWSPSLRARAAVMVVVGLAALGIGAVSLLKRTHDVALLSAFVAVEVLVALVAGARVYLSLIAIGDPASFGAALGVSTSTVIAAAVGIAPAGLGVREALAGTVGVAVGIPVASAVAAAAVDRVASQVGLAATALASGLRMRDLRPGSSDGGAQPMNRQTPRS